MVVRECARRVIPDRVKSKVASSLYYLMGESKREEYERRFQIPSIRRSLRNLRRLGFSPEAIVDVGAFKGVWTQMVRDVFPDARVLMIEAQAAHKDALRAVTRQFPAGAVTYQIALLGALPQSCVPFYETANAGTGSSALPENSDVTRRAVGLPMTTLDAVVASNGFPKPSFIKLDVQGYEIEVLRGGVECLQGAEVVLMEVSLWPYNQGAPLLHDVVAFMKDQEFVAHDVCSLMRRPGDDILIQVDLVFARERSGLRRATPTVWSPAP